MANIVVFGKAQSGKSTLLGYLLSRHNPDFNLDEFEEKTKAALGKNYEPSYLYSYIMDDSKYERIVKKGTRNIHVRKFSFGPNLRVTVIDTPGVEHHVRPKQKAAFLGDIGVFCLELKDVISKNFMSSSKENATIMSTLLLWSNLGHKSIIVALTKCDECSYSEADYLLARKRVNSMCGNTDINNVAVIPISILVSQKRGLNIIERSEEFSWYHKNTLRDELTKKVETLPPKKDGNLLFSVHCQIDKPLSKSGKVWTIKVIQGEISKGEEIIISPVLTEDKRFIAIRAKVKSIRYDLHKGEESEDIDSAGAGDIVGIDIKNIYSGNEKLDKKSFDTLYTTCGFGSKVKYRTSDTFIFSIDSKYASRFTKNREFSLMWFGRGITFSVVESTMIDDHHFHIVAKLKSRRLTLPIRSDGKYYFKRLIIKDENDRLENPYYDGILIQIGGDE